ncbi:hypothetical protein [Mesorhizobium sp. WSM2239]|uniref:DUF5681 domain-containing protein n=2 Tax=unclassified Mesorhizobium TaxID=325217 RepID=A0AAU8D2P5_9HYPH
MTDNAVELRTSTVVQLPNGRWASGNPGRKPGSKNKISNEVLQSIRDMRGDAIQKLWELIMAGDFKAITYVLDKILPRDRTVQMDDASPSTVAEMLISGEASPDEVRSIATALARLNEIGELADIRNKLDQLEKLLSDDVAR